MDQNHPLILIIGTCRSGTTALLYALQRGDGVTGHYQPIKDDVRGLGSFEMPDLSNDFVLIKETLGWETEQVCTYDPFIPKYIPKEIETRSIFILRDPRYTWESNVIAVDKSDQQYKKIFGNRPDLRLFIKTYEQVMNLLKREMHKNPENVSCVIYDSLTGENVKKVFKILCERTGLTYTDKMLAWKKADVGVLVAPEEHKEGIGVSSKKLKKSKIFSAKPRGPLKIPFDPNPEKNAKIEKLLMGMYREANGIFKYQFGIDFSI